MFALADATAGTGCGGKAAHLARLIAAGLPVPDGFAVAGEAFRAIVGDVPLGAGAEAAGHALEAAAERIAAAAIDTAVGARARGLGGLLAVRSSATIEDGEAGAAAGVFSSRRAVPPSELDDAIRAVWTSALTPLAVAYARRRGPAGGLATIGVVVQRFVAGERLTVYTRAPAGTDEVWVQRGAAVTKHARGDDDRVVQLALAAEAAIGAAATGADVELVAGDGGASRPPADSAADAWAGRSGGGPLWLVQARPIVRAPAREARTPPPSIVLAELVRDGRRWTWDLAHNPDPLSPAQAGLVARVADVAPWAMRVCAGYLYTAPRAGPAPALPPDDPHALEAAMTAALGDDDGSPLPLADALARYVGFYAAWAQVSLWVAAARHRRSANGHGARPSSVEGTLLAAARGELTEDDALTRLAPLAPAWDVAVPTFGERPALVREAIARARAEAPPASPRRSVDDVADLAERDDFAFARAQLLVRRALLAHAEALGIAADDIFWLPLEDVVDDPPTPDAAQRRAAAARAAAGRAARWDLPITIGGELAPAPPPGTALTGAGAGGRVTGRIVRFATLASAVAVGRGDIVVTRAVTPALAVLVAGCAAIVSETGGILDHGAAVARELGVPCVVGCAGAWSTLRDGELVCVDGDAATVTRI